MWSNLYFRAVTMGLIGDDLKAWRKPVWKLNAWIQENLTK